MDIYAINRIKMWKLQVIASIPLSRLSGKSTKSLEIPSLLQIMVVGNGLTLVCFVCGM